MSFYQEPNGYTKTSLSDLQGAWMLLRESVVKSDPFTDIDKLLFHIDEAMSWESVRNLKLMKKTLLLIRNFAQKGSAGEEILDAIACVTENLEEVFDAIKGGEIK